MSEVSQWLPEDLENLPPCPDLAALLAVVDRRALSDKDRVRLVQARNRLVSHTQAELFADMYAVSWGEPPDEDPLQRDPDDSAYQWTEMELAFALRWTRTAAGVRLEQARRMIEDLPGIHTALSAGWIDVPNALPIAPIAWIP